MQENIRNALIIITAIGTLLSLYIKSISDFPMELIKLNYKSIPGKQSAFKTVLSIVSWLFTTFYLIILFSFIILAVIDRKENILSQTITFKYVIEILTTVVIISIIIGIPIKTIRETQFLFVEKLENGVSLKYDKYIDCLYRIGLVVNGIILTLCGIEICSVFKTGINIVKKEGLYIFENNINDENIRILIFILIVILICSVSFILLNSAREILKSIKENITYNINFNGQSLTCKVYLEFDEFYLIFNNGTETYIKKSNVSSIVKLYDNRQVN